MISEDNIMKEDRTYTFACNQFSSDLKGLLRSSGGNIKLTANKDIESHVGAVYNFADNPELITAHAKEIKEVSDARLTESAIERRNSKQQEQQVAEI